MGFGVYIRLRDVVFRILGFFGFREFQVWDLGLGGVGSGGLDGFRVFSQPPENPVAEQRVEKLLMTKFSSCPSWTPKRLRF